MDMTTSRLVRGTGEPWRQRRTDPSAFGFRREAPPHPV